MFSLTKFPSLPYFGRFTGGELKLHPPIKLGCLFTTFVKFPTPIASPFIPGEIDSEPTLESSSIDSKLRLDLRFLENDPNFDKHKPPAVTLPMELYTEKAWFSLDGRRIWKGKLDSSGGGNGVGGGSG